MLLGYRHPEDEADHSTAGFFRTGDLGRWVEAVYLVVTGRAKDVISATARTFRPRKSRTCSRPPGHRGNRGDRDTRRPNRRTGVRGDRPEGKSAPDVAGLPPCW